MNGHLAVIQMRVEALALAIREGNWNEVEFQHDRVRRAVEKAIREEADD